MGTLFVYNVVKLIMLISVTVTLILLSIDLKIHLENLMWELTFYDMRHT